MLRKLSFISIILIMAVSSLLVVSAQDNDSSEASRTIRPREYAQKLPQKYVVHRPRASKTKEPTHQEVKYSIENPEDSTVAQGNDIGFTFWRLRESKANDDIAVVEESRIAKREKDGKIVETKVKFTPERTQSKYEFSNGDRIRFTVESPIEGHLYLINREQYQDGKYSDPYLIFPERKDIGQTNKVAPGKLVFIPNETENFILYNVSESNKQKKAAEVFTVLISSEEMKDLPPLGKDEEPRKIETAKFEQWQKEWGGKVWKFEQEGNTNLTITKVEKEASSTKTATLDKDDQLPQTIYHVASKSNNIILFTVVVKIHQ